MPKKIPSFPTPLLLFKKRHSDQTPPSLGPESPKSPSRSRAATWLGRSSSGLAIENFNLEALGARSGGFVFGPLSVFNGIVSFVVKQALSNAVVSVTFRGLTEFNGKQLAFINETEVLGQGNLESGLRTYYFAVRFPPVNLPPTSAAPEVLYSFVAQIQPAQNGENAPEKKSYASRPLELTFVPCVDPFTSSRYNTIGDHHTIEKGENKKDLNAIEEKDKTEIPKSKPRLQIFTTNLPSSSLDPGLNDEARSAKPFSYLGIEKESVIMDGHNRPLAKLRVQLPKARFIPGDKITCTITLTIPPGGHFPKGFTASVVERKWLGFEKDEDADLVSYHDTEIANKHGSKSSQIYTRSLTSTKFPIHPNSAVQLQKQKSSTEPEEASEKSNDGNLEGGLQVVEPLAIPLPNFRAFVANTLLPTASLPLGPCYSETAPTSPLTPKAETPGSSLKGKDPVRPVSRRTVSTVKSTHSNIVQGLHLVVQHFVHVEVPLSSGTILKKSSGVLLVDIPIVLGNKTPDIDRPLQVKPATPQVRVTTPDVVISPPNELGASGSLHRERSKSSFRMEYSPLKYPSSSYLDCDSRSLTPSVGSSKRRENVTSSGSGILSEKEGVAIDAIKKLYIGNTKWRRGERFLTLEESQETPAFIKS